MGMPSAQLWDNGLYFCSKLSWRAVYYYSSLLSFKTPPPAPTTSTERITVLYASSTQEVRNAGVWSSTDVDATGTHNVIHVEVLYALVVHTGRSAQSAD